MSLGCDLSTKVVGDVVSECGVHLWNQSLLLTLLNPHQEAVKKDELTQAGS